MYLKEFSALKKKMKKKSLLVDCSINQIFWAAICHTCSNYKYETILGFIIIKKYIILKANSNR